MNTIPRRPIPAHDYYVRLHWPDLLGGESEVRGPFSSGREARSAISAARAPYPGSHWPSVVQWSVERP